MGARVLVVDDSPTIRRVVATILERRSFEPIVAEDGQDALEKLDDAKVDLILLDFVMPRMNGYQFCRELRSRPQHKALPIVLMSAKGDKIRGQFVQQTGAVDAITKPFDARGLVAVIEGALKKHEEGRSRPVPDVETMPEEDALVGAGSIPPPSFSPNAELGLNKAQTANEFAASLSKLLVPELIKVRGVARDAGDRIGEAIQRAITAESIRTLGVLLRNLNSGEASQEVLSGDISVISIAEILQLLQLQRQTGALAVSTRNREITMYVREGTIDLATVHGLRDEFLIGRYLIELGVVTRNELNTVVKNRAGSKRLLGEMLINLGMIGEEQVEKALTRQTSELVYEVVRWKNGRFTFNAGATSPAAEKAKLGLASGGLVMEGFRRVDEWRLIEGSFDFEEVLFRDQVAIAATVDDSKLTKIERDVLAAIDGERTVREIVDHMSGSSFEVCKILYQFLNSRLVRRQAA
jgi:DNA-binding response OmpR family regulator